MQDGCRQFHSCCTIYDTVSFVPASLYPFLLLLVYAIFQVGYILFLLKILMPGYFSDLSTLFHLLNTNLFLKLILLFSRCFTHLVLLLPSDHFLFPFFLFLFQNVYKPKITNEKDAILFNKFGKYYKLYLFLGNLPNIIRLFYKSGIKNLVSV